MITIVWETETTGGFWQSIVGHIVVEDFLLMLNYFLLTLDEPRVRFVGNESRTELKKILVLSSKRRKAAAPSASEIKDIVIRARVHLYQKSGES